MMDKLQLATELERRREAKKDYLAPTPAIDLKTEIVSSREGTNYSRSVVTLWGDDDVAVRNDLVVNSHAHGQMASRLQIPKRYYDRMRLENPRLLDENVSSWLTHHPGREPANWMVRTLDDTARAFLSDVYRDIDDYDVASVVLPILYGDGSARNPGIPGVRIESCALTDTRMYIKAVTPRVSGEVKVGDEVCAGVVISNSEVGAGSFKVEPLIFRLQCSNGMIVGMRGEGMMRQIHLGQRLAADVGRSIFRDETRAARDRAFLMEIGDVVRAAVDEVNFRDLLAEMSAAAETNEVKNVRGAVQLIQRKESLTETEGNSILTYLAQEGDLTKWGMINAITRVAQDPDSYDRATELESLAGKVLAYPTRQWDEVVEAVPARSADVGNNGEDA